MFYEKPSVEIVGSASRLIQGEAGFGVDGNPDTLNSKIGYASKLEEE
jgi:hypothetical protein